MDETHYHAIADELLEALEETLEEHDTSGELDVELLEGVLTIEDAEGREWVINKHAPTQQIWVASPLSGALHIAFDEEEQGFFHEEESLEELLQRELFG